MNALRRWLAAATSKEKDRLARGSGMSRGALAWAAGGYRSAGRADLSADAARRLELASVRIEREGLPALRREDLCEACGRCELARAGRR